jgi:hypothetical protein
VIEIVFARGVQREALTRPTTSPYLWLEYTEVKMDERAFWISPEGSVYPVAVSHVESVIADPAAFGITKEYVEAVYHAYTDPLGREGMAWRRIVKELVVKKWIKIRDCGEYLSVQLGSPDRNSMSRLRSFFTSVAEGYHPETQVRQEIVSEGTTRIMTIADIREEAA